MIYKYILCIYDHVYIIYNEVAQSCPTLCDPMDCVAYRLLLPWDFPSKKTGVGCHFLLQEIFPTQGLNTGPLHCRQTLYHLSHQGCPMWYICASYIYKEWSIWYRHIPFIYMYIKEMIRFKDILVSFLSLSFLSLLCASALSNKNYVSYI